MWKQLFLETITAPKDAARRLLTINIFGIETWMAFTLSIILNGLVYVTTILIFPDAAPPMIREVNPIPLTIIILASMVLGTLSLYAGGKALQGVANLNDLLILVAWLQVMRLAVQVAGFVLLLVSPVLAALLTTLASFYGIWILLNFVNEAQGYNSFGKSVANMVLGFVGLAFLFSLFISAFGLGAYAYEI